MATKAPKTRCDGTLTESAYLAFIRSTLRSKSLRWPPRANALVAARRPYKGGNKLQKYEYQCKLCLQWFKGKEVIVDHFPVAAGSILKVEDISKFAENLFCDSTNLRVLCNPCHATHTLAESRNVTFDEAKVEQEIIAICKKPAKEVLAFLAKHGYNASDGSNAEKRRTLVTKTLKGEIK